MTSITNSRMLFAFTSPRTIGKIIPEIRLLIENFEGKNWRGNSSLQAEFFDVLYASEYYQGETQPKNKAFAARDRITRAPKALGFVSLDPKLSLTQAGKHLLSLKRTDEIITRQLMKFQLPSPFHTDKGNRFFVKPYLELLRLVSELEGLSKTEIALFFLQLTHINKYSEIKKKIIAFRTARQAITTNRKIFISNQFDKELATIFSKEIRGTMFSTRESKDKSKSTFFATKRGIMRDYADAFIRYLRATQLVTFQSKKNKLIISKFRKEEVAFLLKTVERKPISWQKATDYSAKLFDPTLPKLFTDDKKLLSQKIRLLGLKQIDTTLNTENLKDLYFELEKQQKQKNLQSTTRKLKTYVDLPDILATFEKIKNGELPDGSLFLEWNVWRSLTMLNYGEIQGNFTFDLDNAPLSTAVGNQPDIECSYDSFRLMVEVTLSRGNTQFNMEGESVARHYGNLKKQASTPLYCLFVALQISEGALAHFFNLNRFHTKLYGGKTQIIPITLESFITFTQQGVQQKFSEPNTLKKFLEGAIKLNTSAKDEQEWHLGIEQMAKTWL